MAYLIDQDALLADIEDTIKNSGCVNHESEIMDCIRYAPTAHVCMPDEISSLRAENAGLRTEFDKLSRMTQTEFMRWRETVEAARAALEQEAPRD